MRIYGVPQNRAGPHRSPVSLPGISTLLTSPIDGLLPLVDGKRDRRIRHTPHYQLLRHYQQTGEKLYEHDYARLLVTRARLRNLPMNEAILSSRVDDFCELLESMREHGYRGGSFRRYPITVFEKPIYPPASDYEPLNYEIRGGHHRAAAAAVLGFNDVEVLVLRTTKRRNLDSGEWIPWDESVWPERVLPLVGRSSG